MSDVKGRAREALTGISSGPWTFQHWGEQNQNGDYAESILFDGDGETMVYGMADNDGEFIATAPSLISDLLTHIEEQDAEIAGAKSTIAHMTEAVSWISGHDRTGNDHLDDAMRLAGQMDSIRRAYTEYEAALEAREHGGVAADRLVRAVAAVIAQRHE